MTEDIQLLRLGEATISVINVGDLGAHLDEWITVPVEERPPEYAPFFAEPLRIPTQCILIQLDGITTLVDAGAYDLEPDSPFLLAGYQPPASLPARLAEMNVQPEDVDQVIITHAHWDHYNGATAAQNGHYIPVYPRARHYLGRADWEDQQMQQNLQDSRSLPGRTLAVLQQQRLLDLVDGDRDLGGGIRIVATPGESGGHQAVRVESDGQVLYCVGDLVHHHVEIEQPDWVVPWADAERMRASRKALMRAALQEDALIIATHIRGVGRIQQMAAGFAWTTM